MMKVHIPTNTAIVSVEALTRVESSIFIVTNEGVILPEGATIPAEFIENPFRSSSYGIIENGKFVEKLRIDPGTPTGMKGLKIVIFI